MGVVDDLLDVKEQIKQVKSEYIAKHHDDKNYAFKLRSLVAMIDYLNLTIDLLED